MEAKELRIGNWGFYMAKRKTHPSRRWWDVRGIKYVHQLQNLFYALQHVELQIQK